jgi:general nucleoside transport system ATP-binding protein
MTQQSWFRFIKKPSLPHGAQFESDSHMENESTPDYPLLSIRGITKKFPGILANDHIDLDICGGSIQALLGENGAGKSTLMKILYGYYRADSGEILINGNPVLINSPHDARDLGIGMVFQNFTLIPALNVIDNIALFLPNLPPVIDRREIISLIERVSEQYGLQINPYAYIKQLSAGERQKVEIIKLLLAKARVLIFDEPTKVLAPHEIEGLMQVFANLRRDGYAVVFITHKLQEVLACADQITVLRQGKIAGTISRTIATESKLISLMFGTAPPELKTFNSASSKQELPPILELKQVHTSSKGGITGLRDINLTVKPGEIVGIAGVSGNGQGELGDVILGLEPCLQGAKFLFGQNATKWSVGKIRESMVAFIPEDPMMAAVPGMSVPENIALCSINRYTRNKGFSIDWQAVRADTERSLLKLGLKMPPLDTAAGTLSGGNFQRVVLAREMSRSPKLVIAFYPTRSLDVPGANAAREMLLAARDSGAGVLLISEDLGELFMLSDRLIVLYHGQIAGDFRPPETTFNEVGRLMTGSRGEHATH